MATSPSKNILFISIDDLNDWTNGLGGYAGSVHTPHLDSLMASGTTFANAFSQAAICNPSRTSILTGKTPNETGVFQNQTGWEGRIDPAHTLFGVLKDAGYQSVGVGKLFHTGPSADATAQMFDRYEYLGQTLSGVERHGLPAGPYDEDVPLRDEVRADFIADFLAGHQPTEGRPLLLSAGLLKPHTDWVVPRAFFDLYPIEDIVIDAVPDDVADLSRFIRENAGITHPWGHDDIGSVAEWKGLIQAYLATISFMDAQVGKMLDALDDSAIADNTTVMLWSDHGYHLGDKDVWHKFTLWDNAGRAPLIIRDPDIGAPGEIVEDVVELLDIFPTLLDLVDVAPPSGLDLSGESLRPYLEGSRPEGEPAAFTWMYGAVSVRTNEFRYSIYEDGSEELYDVRADPELVTNLAAAPGFAAVKADLRARLDAEFNLRGYDDHARSVTGSAGADIFADEGGSGVFAGGAGDDIYFVDEDKTLIERFGEGRDLIVTSARDFTIPEHFEDVEILGRSSFVRGNGADNTITANARRIEAFAGDDVVYGANRDQWMSLGEGADYANGQIGDDTMLGGAGGDTLNGAVGADRLFGGGGADLLAGGFGEDRLEGGAGRDTLLGEGESDELRGGRRSDRLEGGFGDDRLFGGEGRDRLFGQTGDDTLGGGVGDDLLDGGAGEDLLLGQAGRDRLFGQAGNDTLYGGAQDDELDGGSGADRLFGGASRDRLTGAEGEDALDGGARRDLLAGGSGGDQLFGGGGRDRLAGQAGGDDLRGGAGGDLLSGGGGGDTLLGEGGDDTLRGGADGDTLEGGAGDDVLIGGAGRDQFVFSIGAGGDRIRDFRDGADRIRIETGADGFADLRISLSSDGAVVRFADVEILFESVALDRLDPADFIF